MQHDCGVVFLAGGRSSRMGAPKAWLEFAGKPLLQILVERMLHRFPEAVVVAAPGQELPETAARVIFDDNPGEGPVAGLVVGLREVRRPLAFVSSCDVPFLNPDLAEYMADRAAEYDVVVPEWQGRLHPLQAVYRTSVQPLLERNLSQGKRRPVDLYPLVRTLTLRDDDLRGVDPEGRSFLNMNTPEEYEQAKALWEERGSHG